MNWERCGIWWRAFRFHYATASIMPGMLGGMIAWVVDGQFHPGYFLLVMLGLVLNHLALNMTDEYFDFRHLVDAFANHDNPYAGGSRVLSEGILQPKEMLKVFYSFYVVAIGIGVLLGMLRGPFVLSSGLRFLLRFFCSPPIRLATGPR
jgi:1,4-dihydroxy-2-naphthoate octaprenyltransferase